GAASEPEPEPEPKPGRKSWPTRAESADSTLEERLERLEKMVESLMARKDAPQNPYPMKRSADKVGPMDRKEIAEMEFRHYLENLPKLEEKLKEQAKQEAARAADLTKRGRGCGKGRERTEAPDQACFQGGVQKAARRTA